MADKYAISDDAKLRLGKVFDELLKSGNRKFFDQIIAMVSPDDAGEEVLDEKTEAEVEKDIADLDRALINHEEHTLKWNNSFEAKEVAQLRRIVADINNSAKRKSFNKEFDRRFRGNANFVREILNQAAVLCRQASHEDKKKAWQILVGNGVVSYANLLEVIRDYLVKVDALQKDKKKKGATSRGKKQR